MGVCGKKSTCTGHNEDKCLGECFTSHDGSMTNYCDECNPADFTTT
jgi:hypothetical protein